MMAKRSQKVPELKGKTELKCKWGLFSIFESCQGRRVSRKLISNGRRLVNQQITEYPRKSEQLTRFDEECQRFQSEVDLASVTKSTSGLSIIQEKECTKVESKLADHLMESQRKLTRKPTHHHKPLASEEMPPSKITFAEVLRTASPRHDNNLAAEPEDIVRSYSARMYDSNLDEIHMHRVQMGAKALVDQMFIERRLKDQLNSESKSFSKALEVLSSTKTLHSHKNDKEPFKGRPKEDSLRRSSFTAPPDDEIVVLKPKRQSPKYSEDVSCHCSSMQYHHAKSSVPVRESDSFSFKKMKKRLKHRLKGPKGPGPFLTCGDSYVLPQNGSLSASETGNDLQNTKSCVDPKTKDKLWKRPDLKHKAGSDFSSEDRKKLDFDVILEAKRHLSSRLESLSAFDSDTTCKKKPPRTLGRVLLSPERDFKALSPKRESEIFSGSAQMRCSVYNSPPQASNISFMKQIERQRTCLSPSRSTREVLDREEESSLLIPSTGEESLHDTVKSNDDPKVVMRETTPRQESNGSEAACMIVSQNEEEYNTIEHSTSGSVSENEASTSTASTIIHPLDIADAIKYQEEHQSPVSVLEPVFTEEANSPPSIMSQTDKQTLQPCRLDFEDQFIIEHCCIEEQDRITQYIQLVLQASRLNWDRLSAIESLPEETEIVSESLFDELDFPLTDDHCCFEPKLLFDHINEVLLDLYAVCCCGSKRLPGIRQVALDKLVIDKVMNEAEFYILPRTERRTLDQLVSKDVRNCRSWLDVRSDTEQIVTEISDDVLVESILDILVGIQS